MPGIREREAAGRQAFQHNFNRCYNLHPAPRDNAPGSVTYVIEAKIGDTAPYVMVGTSTKQSFKHTGCRPGEFYQYHVRAQAAQGIVSDWSNEAGVYGI